MVAERESVFLDHDIPDDKRSVFGLALEALQREHIPVTVGGGLALYFYTGVLRNVHDFDVHLLPEDVEQALRALRAAGFEAFVKHPQWLAQAWRGDVQVDLIFGQGSWHQSVDSGWVAPSFSTLFLGHQVNIIPPEEFFWSKAMRCSRLRCDAPDLFHFLVAQGQCLDWPRLVDLFGEHWEVLLSHLIMFRYVFPSHAGVIPDEIMDELLGRLEQSRQQTSYARPICRGPLLDSSGPYLPDVEERGYIDERQVLWERRRQREPVLQRLEELTGH